MRAIRSEYAVNLALANTRPAVNTHHNKKAAADNRGTSAAGGAAFVFLFAACFFPFFL